MPSIPEKKKEESRRRKDPLQLTRSEARETERRIALRAAVVHEAIRAEGEEELQRSSPALAWSGLAAGLSMGFSMVMEGLLRAHLPDAEWRPLLAKLGYPVGFLIVVLGRQQLFTENTLTVVLPLLQRRDAATFKNVMRLWGIVLLTNLTGALLIAWAAGETGAFQPEVRTAFSEIGREAIAPGFRSVLVRGIFGGWLIALMVWLLPFAEAARFHVIFLITYLVGLGGFSHIIAGSIEMFHLAITGLASWGEVLGGYILPTLLGNTIGGVALVAAINHAQVAADKRLRLTDIQSHVK